MIMQCISSCKLVCPNSLRVSSINMLPELVAGPPCELTCSPSTCVAEHLCSLEA